MTQAQIDDSRFARVIANAFGTEAAECGDEAHSLLLARISRAYASAATAILDDIAVPPGERYHPDFPLVLERAEIEQLCRDLEFQFTLTSQKAAYALRAMLDDWERGLKIGRFPDAAAEIECVS